MNRVFNPRIGAHPRGRNNPKVKFRSGLHILLKACGSLQGPPARRKRGLLDPPEVLWLLAGPPCKAPQAFERGQQSFLAILKPCLENVSRNKLWSPGRITSPPWPWPMAPLWGPVRPHRKAHGPLRTKGTLPMTLDTVAPQEPAHLQEPMAPRGKEAWPRHAANGPKGHWPPGPLAP